MDHDLILHLLVNIHNQQVEGTVLVFLPGYEDFSIVKNLIGSQSLLSRDISKGCSPLPGSQWRAQEGLPAANPR